MHQALEPRRSKDPDWGNRAVHVVTAKEAIALCTDSLEEAAKTKQGIVDGRMDQPRAAGCTVLGRKKGPQCIALHATTRSQPSTALFGTVL